MRSVLRIGATALIALALAAPAGAAASPARVAALQSALQALHLYRGYVDGVNGPLTRHAVLALQRGRGLAVDGVAGPQTRRALGWRGWPGLGSRTMRAGQRGWDVAALQFLLQRAGHGAGRADGLFGPLTEDAVRRAQEAAGIGVDGLAGPATLASLRGGSAPSSPSSPTSPAAPGGPVRFLRPVAGPIGDGFGADRGDHLHTGLDFPVPYGTPVAAAGVGTVIFAGYNTGGYGNLVVVQHRLGYSSWYAHLSSIATSDGAAVAGGSLLGYVGSTGHSTGPHLHFEVRRYDTPIDPLPLLLDQVARRRHGAHRPGATGGCDGMASLPPAPRSGDGARRGGAGRDGAGRAGAGDWIAAERLCAER